MPTVSKSSKVRTTKLPIPKTPKSIFSNVFFYIFIGFLAVLLFSPSLQNGLGSDKRPISELISLLKQNKIQQITVSADTLEVQMKDGTKFISEKESDISFDQILANSDVDKTAIPDGIKVVHNMTLEQILSPLLMFGLPVLLFFLIFRQMKSSSGDIFSFGRSRAKLFNKEQSKITFEDVFPTGNPEAMDSLDYESSDPQELTMNFRCDHWTEELT